MVTIKTELFNVWLTRTVEIFLNIAYSHVLIVKIFMCSSEIN